MARQPNDRNPVKRYLLQQLSDPERQEIELRILNDDNFSAELEAAEDELIDEYLADELSSDERERFEQNFLTTPARHSKLRSSEAMKRYFDKLPDDPFPKGGRFESLRKWLRKTFLPSGSSIVIFSPAAIAIFMVFAFVGLLIWYTQFYRSNLRQGLLALNKAYSQERPIEARISTLDYARFEPERGNKSELVDALELSRAEYLLREAEKQRADAVSFQALGKLYLLQREYGKAIEYLEKATKADPRNAQISADLGAAYLERGKLELEASGTGGGKGLEDLGRSLENLKLALEIDPSLPEALFNRGLVHEAQNLEQEAEADWRAYLAKDATSQWAVEAQKHLKFLEEKKSRRSQNSGKAVDAFLRAYHAGDDTTAWDIYRRSYSSSGNDVIKELLDRVLANKDPASSTENLQALSYVGQLETSRTGDPYSSDLAKVYASSSPQTQALLVEARQQVVKGYEQFNQSRIGGATESFTNARSTFEKVGDLPELLAADTAIARGAAIQPDLVKGQKLLGSIVAVCEAKNYKWLLAQALTVRAHIQSNLNNFSDAIIDGNRALGIFQELKDLSGTLGSFIQLASLHLFLNDTRTSFSFLQQAMTIAREDNALPRQQWGVYIAASQNLSSLHLYRAALDYQHEALQLAVLSGIPLLISRSYQNIGLTYGSLRQLDLAFENVHRAYDQGRPLAAELNGQNMMANASLRLGDLYRMSGDENSALAAYEESSRLYEALDFAHYSYAAHKGKFLAYLAQHNDAMAAQELQIVLNLFEKYREKILGERQKSFFFDREQDIYDLAIDFVYSRLGDERRAFDYSEICRARNLGELMRHGAEVTSSANGLDLRTSKSVRSENALPLTATEIQQQLPKEVQVIQYAVLENKLLLWYITRTEIITKVVEVDSVGLTEMVETTLNQIKQRDANGAETSLKNLHRLLIEPLSGQLDPKLLICFVPDKVLHFVPFSALQSMRSGRYLVQDYRVMTSPSTSILIKSTNKARTLAALNEERLLAVGNPSFDRSINPNLSSLRDAEREVREIALNYPVQRVLIGSQATPKSVEDELVRAQVVHFAAHYQIDEGSPLASKLLLSPERGERPAQLTGLNSGDIYQMNLARTRLVILSACQTGIEQQLRGEGPIGFARSFLVAGVPVVVASLWPVNSEATSELMILFHRFRKVDHLSTSAALMRAQQEMAAREAYHDPYYWAAFTAIGGYSEF
ncbi:MAG TPA: CHAT domain-containing protein [Pyrinomonadaceae bacterium]|nr:CHAT domain-containing protein [Pyrinomonadaceae bacterium]